MRKNLMRKKIQTAVLGFVAIAGVAVPGPATAGDSSTTTAYARGCVAKFEAAQRTDMESFRDYDAEAFRAVHDPHAVSIFAAGDRFAGIDSIMAALEGQFPDREALWSWTEVNRRVDGCKAAFVEYETVYEIPRIGYYQRALTVVTYVYRAGHWRVISDHGSRDLVGVANRSVSQHEKVQSKSISD